MTATSMNRWTNLSDPLTLVADPEWHADGDAEANLTLDYVAHLDDSEGYVIVSRAQTVLMPVIFVVGVAGNCLAIGCFLSQSLRATSCCLYMAAKCASDTVFLATLLLVWLYRLHVDLLNVQGVCQLTVFLSYISGFVSVWLVLAVTYENYVRVCCPFRTRERCTRRVAFTVTGLVVIFALGFYSFALWTTSVLGEGGLEPLCMTLIKFKDVMMVMTFADTVITLVLPCLLMVPLVVASLVGVLRSLSRKSRLQDPFLHAPLGLVVSTLEAKVIRFLLSVSLTFLLLHTPVHFIRLKLLVHIHILHLPFDATDLTLQRLFETLYYLNSCCSVFIFLASGANFRVIFKTLYCSGSDRGASCRAAARVRGSGPSGLGAATVADNSLEFISLPQRGVAGTYSTCENRAFCAEPESGPEDSLVTGDTAGD